MPCSRKYPYPVEDGHRKSQGGGESYNFFFQMEYKAKLKILEGCVKVKTKQFPWGGMDIFRDHTFCNYCG